MGIDHLRHDSEDLYVYDTNPENANQYKYQGGWESMKVIRESIPVKGEHPRDVELSIHATGRLYMKTRLTIKRTPCARRGSKPAVLPT